MNLDESRLIYKTTYHLLFSKQITGKRKQNTK